jgi:hypothetical protein
MEQVDKDQNELLARLDERYKRIDEKIDAILIQTTKTNGRLTKAEEELNKLITWKSQWKAIYSFLGVIGTIIVLVLGIFLK